MITIYYDTSTVDQSDITKEAIVGLLREGNTAEDISQAIGAEGFRYEDLSSVDSSLFGCEEAERVVEEGKVRYVIEVNVDGEPFFYIGG